MRHPRESSCFLIRLSDFLRHTALALIRSGSMRSARLLADRSLHVTTGSEAAAPPPLLTISLQDSAQCARRGITTALCLATACAVRRSNACNRSPPSHPPSCRRTGEDPAIPSEGHLTSEAFHSDCALALRRRILVCLVRLCCGSGRVAAIDLLS